MARSIYTFEKRQKELNKKKKKGRKAPKKNWTKVLRKVKLNNLQSRVLRIHPLITVSNTRT